MQKEQVKQTIISAISEILGVSEEEISCERKLQDYGLDSIVGVEMVGRLNKCYGLNLSKTAVYTYPTVNQLTEYVVNSLNNEQVKYFSSEDDYNNSALGRYGRNMGQEGSVTETYKVEKTTEKSKMDKLVEKLSEKYGDLPSEVYEGVNSPNELAQRVSDYLNMKEFEENGKKH